MPCSAGRYEPSRPPRQKERLHRLERRVQLVALDGAGRVDVLRAHLGALSHERAAPDALVLGPNLEARRGAFIARIEVVALSERDRRGSNELRIETVDRTRGVTEHAVDAHAVLFVLI